MSDGPDLAVVLRDWAGVDGRIGATDAIALRRRERKKFNQDQVIQARQRELIEKESNSRVT